MAFSLLLPPDCDRLWGAAWKHDVCPRKPGCKAVADSLVLYNVLGPKAGCSLCGSGSGCEVVAGVIFFPIQLLSKMHVYVVHVVVVQTISVVIKLVVAVEPLLRIVVPLQRMVVVVRCVGKTIGRGDAGEVAVKERDSSEVGNVKQLAAGKIHICEEAVVEGCISAIRKQERRVAAGQVCKNGICNIAYVT